MDSKALPQMTQKPEIDRDVRQFLADGEPRRRLSVIVEARFDDKPTGAALQERLKPLASIRGPKLVRKQISQSPAVGAIRLNREHHVPK